MFHSPTQSTGSFHSTCNGTSEKATESSRENGGGHVYTETLRLFLLLVPRTDDQENTRRETSLENTHQNAERDEMVEIMNGGHDTGKCSPDDHNGWQVDGGLEADEKHVRWRLEHDICDEKHDEGDRVLV